MYLFRPAVPTAMLDAVGDNEDPEVIAPTSLQYYGIYG